MIIDKEIREAIRRAAENSGSPYRLSKALGVRHTTIRDWLSGKTKSISDENWERVRTVVGTRPAEIRGRERRYLISLLYFDRERGTAHAAETYGTFSGLSKKSLEDHRKRAAAKLGVPVKDVVILSAMELEE